MKNRMMIAGIMYLFCVSLCVAFGNDSKLVTTSTLTEKEILYYAPEGSKLANDIVTSSDLKTMQNPVIYRDIDLDGENEIVVAYYTKPHSYIVEGKPNEAYYERAHIMIMHLKDGQYYKQWDSGGYGGRFGIKLLGHHDDKYMKDYYGVVYEIVDINNNGMPDIICSRRSMGSTTPGSLEAWEWNGKTYQRIFAATSSRLAYNKDGSVKEIISDDYMLGYKYKARIAHWDKIKKQFYYDEALTHAGGRISLPAKMETNK